jgi:hypothetical protein
MKLNFASEQAVEPQLGDSGPSGAGPPSSGSLDSADLREAESTREGRFVLTAALFVLSLTIFIASPLVDHADSMYSVVLSESILHHFSTHMNWFKPPHRVDTVSTSMQPLTSATDTYQLGWLHGELIYRYPNGTSILSLPFVAVANFAGIHASSDDGVYDKEGEFVIQRLLASLLMAVLVSLVFRTATLLLGWQNSLLIAITFAFGTQAWSTATRALWSHTWLIFLEGWVIHLLLKYDETPGELPVVWLATLLSWMFFVRPTAVVPLVCVTLLVFCSQPWPRSARFATVGALWFGAFIAYSWFTFGEFIPGYYHSSRLDFQHCWISVAANLFSPSRGLFVYVPISGLVLYLSIRHWSTLPHRRLAVLSLGVIIFHVLVLAGQPVWWAGWSYGPRFMTDVLPWLVLLAILATPEVAERKERLSTILGWRLALILVAVSIALNARGALLGQAWNAQVEVDQHPERVFDWSYPEFTAGFIHPPTYTNPDVQRSSDRK